MTYQAGPVEPAERIRHLDVLRGLGVLGILMMNIIGFALPFHVYTNPTASPFPLEGASAAQWWVAHTFFEMKFITLFTMLFGVSIYLVGGERRDPERGPVLRRRLSWLLLFGLVHGLLIWFGDILLHYAIFGLLMLLCRSWSARRLTIVGLILFALGAVLMFLPAVVLAAAPPDVQAEQSRMMWDPGAETVRREIERMAGSLAGAFQLNLRNWTIVQVASLVFGGPRTLGLMMIGLALFKSGVLQGRRSTAFYAMLALLGAAAAAVIGWRGAVELERGFRFPEFLGEGMLANGLLSPVVTLGYVGLVALLLRGSAGRVVSGPLAAVGQMAFSNYIAQSLVMTTIFYGGRGLGLHGEFDRPELVLFVLAVWAAQLVWSPLWLSRFRMGPLEWLWRRLSYGRPIPLRRERALQGAPVPAA